MPDELTDAIAEPALRRVPALDAGKPVDAMDADEVAPPAPPPPLQAMHVAADAAAAVPIARNTMNFMATYSSHVPYSFNESAHIASVPII
jgi:hypothetical protein